MAKFNYVIDHISRVMDGDTLEAVLDLGFKIGYTVIVRINGIDAPEKKDKAASDAVKAHITDWLTGGELTLVSHEWDKYGRVLGDLVGKKGSLSEFLIMKKLVREYKGDKKLPWTQAELDNIAKVV